MRNELRYADPRTSNLFKLGADLRGFVETEFETNPRFADEFFATKLPGAIGDAAAVGLTTGGLQLLGVSPLVSQSVIRVMTESLDLFLKALKDGESIEYAYEQFGAGHLLGMAHGLPVGKILGRVTGPHGTEIRRLLIEAMGEGTKDAALNAVKQSMKEAIKSGAVDAEEVAAVFTAEAKMSLANSLLIPK